MLEQADISNRAGTGPEPPFFCLDGDASRGCLLICDHASNRIPPELGGLGIDPSQMERHIAYDIGAAAVTKFMARKLGVPAVLSNFSRLLIDPNRGEDDPTLVMRLSDGATIPGNARIGADEIERRLEQYYRPYHDAIDAALTGCLASGRPPVIVSMHSFTDNWRGRGRPWQVGILWDRDPRLAVPLIAKLAEDTGLTVGDNEPYSGALKNDCLYKHGTGRGLAHALVEVRQDLIRDEAGQEAWAERLVRSVSAILGVVDADDKLHKIEFFGSRADSCSGNDRSDGPLRKE